MNLVTSMLMALCVSGGIDVDNNGNSAKWANYGVGYAGTNGVPALTLSDKPKICTQADLQIGNSSGVPNTGLLLISPVQDVIATSMGGNILVGLAPHPFVARLITIPAAGLNLPVFFPCLQHDDLLIGVHFYLQVLELDLGAPGIVSFSRGLDLRIGQ